MKRSVYFNATMGPLSQGCLALVVELVVYVWCNATRLLFYVWFSWTKPRPIPPVTDDLLLRSASSLAADIRIGKVRSVQLLTAYIKRIRQVQPIINAVVEERFEEALREAEEADRLVASGSVSVEQMAAEKPLLGLPLSVKNNIAVKGLLQDAGSPDWKGHRPGEDAPSVARLRAAGAIPLVLTNVPELCMWGDAQNLLYGTTRNPHDTRRSPGGSSGGEGSLIAAAGSLIGVGTDIAGSVRIPAAYCGIFGHKATSGIVPSTGLIPNVGDAMRQYVCVGPMTRFSEDLPLLLNVLAAGEINALRLNKPVDLKSLKLFFMATEGCRYFSRTTYEAQQAVLKVTRHFKGTHGLQTQPLHLPELQYVAFTFKKLYSATDPEGLAQLFSPSSLNAFLELLRFLVGRGRHTLPVLFACATATWFPFASPKEASKFLADIELLRDRFEETLGDDGVLILPAATSGAPFQNQDLLFIDAPSMTALFSIFKVPATVCPVTLQKHKDGTRLPLAVQVVAKRGNDRLCLAVAREIERKFSGWLAPGATA